MQSIAITSELRLAQLLSFPLHMAARDEQSEILLFEI